MVKKQTSLISRGFTLIELMIVVAIIGILAAIAVPKFADMVRKSQEAATKGSLGGLRSAIMIYFTDNEGAFPPSLTDILNPKYINEMPYARRPPYHTDANGDIPVLVSLCPRELAGRLLIANTVGWCYGVDTGQLMVNCIHTDGKGNLWSSY